MKKVINAAREHSNIVFEAVEKSQTANQLNQLQKSMHSDASKVKVKGTGIQKAFRNQKAQFVVDTRDAGKNATFFFFIFFTIKFVVNIYIIYICSI